MATSTLRWTPRVTVAAIAMHDNRFLMVEEIVDGRRCFNQPAGHLENGESLTAAVVREVREETGLAFTPGYLVAIYRWPMTLDITFLRFLFAGAVDQPHLLAPSDPAITAAHWLTRSAIDSLASELRSPQVLAGIDDYLRGARVDLNVLRDLDGFP